MTVTRVPLSEDVQQHFRKAFSYIEDWCAKHQWQVGAAEMALGASLVAVGIKSGVIEMGVDLVASVLDGGETAGLVGGTAGTSIGLLAMAFLTKCGTAGAGIVALGTGFSLPALVLLGGGALVLGLAGYGLGHLVHEFMTPSLGMAQAAGGSLLLVGLALMVDGARRIAKDEVARGWFAELKDGALNLSAIAADAVLRTREALESHLNSELGEFVRALANDPKAFGLTAGVTAVGVSAGSAVAASSVTVLGSQTLGGVALSLGLVSAPVWPLIAGGGLALASAYGVWKLTRRQRDSRTPPGDPVAPRVEALGFSSSKTTPS